MGSGRLKHFCEVCRKQCKDQNGYHCHLSSAHHQKKLRQLATNPQQHIEKYSRDLQSRFLQTLKVKYPGVEKNVEDLYEQYTLQSHHIKFSFTQWKNLQEFIEHLKKTGRNLKIKGKVPNCTITYLVSKSSDFVNKKRQQQIFQKREKQKKVTENRIEQQIAKGKEIEEEMFKIMRSKILAEQEQMEQLPGDRLELQLDIQQDDPRKRSSLFSVNELQKQYKQDLNMGPRKIKNIQKLYEDLKNTTKDGKQEQEQEQEQEEWICSGITVKILPHQIPEAFHHKKCQILKITEPFTAELQVGNATLQVDQSYLQTVIPKINHTVKIVKANKLNRQNKQQYKGELGILKEIDIENGFAKVQLRKGINIKVAFNQFSKFIE